MLLDGRQPVDPVVVGVAFVVLGDQARRVGESEFLQSEHPDVPIKQQVHAGRLVSLGDRERLDEADRIDGRDDLFELSRAHEPIGRLAGG